MTISATASSSSDLTGYLTFSAGETVKAAAALEGQGLETVYRLASLSTFLTCVYVAVVSMLG